MFDGVYEVPIHMIHEGRSKSNINIDVISRTALYMHCIKMHSYHYYKTTVLESILMANI